MPKPEGAVAREENWPMDEADPDNFGVPSPVEFKQLRLQSGLTQKKLVERVPSTSTPTTISNYESGKREMNLTTMRHCLKVFRKEHSRHAGAGRDGGQSDE